jgi:hypothetical protein
MRVLVVLAMLCGTAAAERLVIMEPALAYKCPKARTWDLMTACMQKHGTLKIVKTFPKAKVVSFFQKQGARRRDTGLYLYVERGGQWVIGGVFEAYYEYKVLAVERQTIGKHTGYRIDIGQSTPAAVFLDDTTHVTGTTRTQQSLFCSGLQHHCIAVPRTCEVFVKEQTRFVFRGTFEIDLQAVTVKGDRSRAGQHCQIQPKYYLGWPTTS